MAELDTQVIVNEALALEVGVMFAKLATEDELAAIRPVSPDEGFQWLRYYGQLQRIHARVEFGRMTQQSDEVMAKLDAMVMDAMRAAPERVRIGAPEGAPPKYLKVYPKSCSSLLWIHGQDRCLEWMAQHSELLARVHVLDTLPEQLATYERLSGAMATELRKMVAVLCHPGPKLPFDPSESESYVPPEWTEALDPVEIMGVHAAHTKINFHRLNALKLLIASDAPEEESGGSLRASWSVFIGVAAVELGVRPETLMSDWSLGEVLAAFRLSAAAKKDAMDAAKSRSENRREAAA